jgi:prepilin peptidase CpaA
MAAATLAPSHVVLLAALSTVAAGYDVWRRRIPNWLTVGIAASGMAAQAVAFGARGAGSAVLSVLLVLVLLTAMWRFRLIGGGDAKLGAAAAAWVGWGQTASYLVLSAVVGGLIALACYAAAGASSRAAVHVNLSRLRAPSLDEIGRQPGAVLVPYGAAFAVAALVVVLS